MEFRYTVDVNSDEPVMLINKHIGFDSEDGFGIDGSSFQAELLALDTMGKSKIQVWINSPGGSVLEGMSIYNAILKSKTKVDTYCAGICASIAAVIFQAGRNRVMSDYGLLMYHNPYNQDGTKDEGLDKIKGSLVSMISGRCSKTESEISAMMDKTTWITASEAMDSGLCDKVEMSSDYNKKRMVQQGQDMRAYWKESNVVLNNLFNKNSKMIKVANKLGLNPDSSEDVILNAVTDVQNKLASAEAKNKENEDKILELEIAQESKAKELETIQNELAELKKTSAEVEDNAKTEKATAMVQNFAKEGRIKNDAETIEKWVNKAKEDFDGVKALIEELPLNKKSEKLDGDDNKEARPYNMAAAMFEINSKTNLKQQ